MDTNEPSDQPQHLVPARIQANPIAVARPMAVAPAADEVGPAVSLRVVMRALTRHWWQILAVWGVLSVASIYAITKYVFPNYRAIGLLQVEPDPGSPFLSGMRATENFEGYLETQVNLLASPHVMKLSSLESRIAEIPRIRDSADPVDEMSRIVRAMVRPKTRLIEVSATTKSPLDSATIVKSVMEQYLRFIAIQSGKSDSKLRTNLEKFKRDIELEVEKIKAEILTLAASGVSPTSVLLEKTDPARAATTEITHEQFSDYSSRLFTTKIERMAAETELAERRAAQEPGADPRQGREQMVRHLFQGDPEVRKLREDISAARAKLESSGSRSKKNDPANKAIQRKIASMMQQHDEHWKQKYPVLSAQVASGSTNIDTGAELRKLEARVSSLKAAETSYEQSLAQIKVAKRRDSSDAVNMEFLGEELRASRVMLESLEQRIQDMEFNKGGEARIIEVGEVVLPTGPMSDYRTKLMAGAPLGLMILVAGFFMVLEIRAGRVGTPEDLALRSRVEILGVLPPLPMTQPTRSLASSARREDQRAAFVQSLDHLRVSLCGESHQGGRCVVITSAVGGEGKTTLSVQLAARFAQAGVSTVLIDGDLRRASLSRLLDASESAGFSDVLQGDIDVEAALSVCGQAGGFHLLSAGTMGIDPGRLLQGRNVGQILAKLRQSFDVVIIDTPPVLPVPDALTLARWADGAVLAVRRDASRFPLVEQANRRLLGAGIAVLGAVVNGVPSAHSNYGSGYNYSSPSRVAEATA